MSGISGENKTHNDMGNITPTIEEIELYRKLRKIVEPHRMYPDQIMAISKFIIQEYGSKKGKMINNQAYQLSLFTEIKREQALSSIKKRWEQQDKSLPQYKPSFNIKSFLNNE